MTVSILKWTGSEYRFTRSLADNGTLQDWLQQEGSLVLEQTFRETRVRWFFGRARARANLLNDARQALKPDGRFAQTARRELGELPKLIRQIGTQIRRKKHRDLYTVDNAVTVVVVPRAIALNELTIGLVNKLVRSHSMARFKGLPARILREIATDAEQTFFEYICGGKQYLHTNRRALVLGADAEFSWQMSNVNGHYYCAYSTDESRDLARRQDARAFSEEMKEVMVGQTVHLNRLGPEDIQNIARSFQMTRAAEPVG